MNDFDPNAILRQWTPDPLTASTAKFDDLQNQFTAITPHLYCGTNRGFYFQPMLVECNFSKYAPEHASKPSFVFIRWKPSENKDIRTSDGTSLNLPVLAFTVYVNRELFPPQPHDQNSVEWYTTICLRTKAIAHELIYADQYAKYFDPLSGASNRAIEIPDVDQEDELLCPAGQIHSFLDQIKQTYGISWKSSSEFVQQQATTAVQSYYQLWLTKLGVERDVCHRRTKSYLQLQLHVHESKIPNALRASMKRNGVERITPAQFKQHCRKNSTFAVEYISSMRELGVDCGSNDLQDLTLLVIRRNGGTITTK